MGALVDFLQLADRDVGVDLGGLEFGVSEDFLDEADVRAVLVHVGGQGVSEQVTGTAFADVGGLDVSADQLGQAHGREGFSEVGEEKGFVTAGAAERDSYLFGVFVNP